MPHQNSVLISALLTAAMMTGCTTTPPGSPENACRIFQEKEDWFEAAEDVEQRWGVPIQIQLAIIRQESSFKHNAKPPRASFLGMPMWWRKSSAFGYAQVKDSTWDWYRDKTGNRWADRDEFGDAVDFIGWYANVSHRTLGISKLDVYNQYLAYHEGHGGWKRKSYNKKPWLQRVARKVEGYARSYGAQLKECRGSLGNSFSWWPF